MLVPFELRKHQDTHTRCRWWYSSQKMKFVGIFLSSICALLLLLNYGEAQNATQQQFPVVDLKEIQKIINGPDNTTGGNGSSTTTTQATTSSSSTTPVTVPVSISQSTSTTTVKVTQSSSTSTSKAPSTTVVTTQAPTTSAATKTTTVQVNAKVTPPTTTTTAASSTSETLPVTTLEQGTTEPPLILAPFLSELEEGGSAPEALRESTTQASKPTEPPTTTVPTTSTTTEEPTTTPEPMKLGPIVKITRGDIQSVELRSRGGRKYFAFRGIPYANPPSNYQRFKEPAPVSPWSHVLNGTAYGPSCIQYNILSEKVEGVEDCLTLNIFTPKVPMGRGKKKGEVFPVMVFFHQGAFMFGTSSDFEEKYMMDENVVLVTVNYRVGAFGFLNTEGESDAKGNQGLKDQVLALQFIQENIHYFNGERNAVTIFGESAGASSVHYHLLSERSRGLFHRAISMSGTALSPWAFTRSPRKMAKKLGTFLNCPTTDMSELFACLQGIDANLLAEKTKALYEWNTDPITPFAPSIEVEASTSAFMTQSPYTLMKNGHIDGSTPWILGVVENVCLLDAWFILVNPELLQDINVDWHRISPVTFMYKETALEPDAVSNQIRAYYFGTNDIGNATASNLTNLYSDRYFNHGIRTSALLHARTNEAVPIYLYMFTYRGEQSHTSFAGISDIIGVSEGDELRYLFNTNRFTDIPANTKDGDLSKRFVKLWYSFAKTGKPTDVWGAEEWKPISAAQVKGDEALMYYSLNSNCSFVEEPFSARLNFWDNLPLNENENELVGSLHQRHQGEDYDLFSKD